MLIKQQAQAYNEFKKDIALAPVDIVNELVGEYKTMDHKIRDQMVKDLIITSSGSAQPVIKV